MQHKHYDFIMAGGGLAGLSLACHMVRTHLRERQILIVDQDTKEENDRTWGFWTNTPTIFDDAVWRTWSRMHVISGAGHHTIDLGTYRYKVIRGADFYEEARQQLAPFENVTFLQGSVERIEDGRTAATVTVDGRRYQARWVFDSLPYRPTDTTSYQYLKMHFRGWEIRTPEPAFNAETVTFMDFRTPQTDEMRFFYILPFAADRALVEYTIFSKHVLRRKAYEQALQHYLAEVLNVSEYEIISEEAGAVPITDNPLIRTLGRHIMGIGARAGRIKPSTGYAFMRVQQDAEQIVDSLLLHGHPFDVPDDPDLYDVLDAVLLKVIHQNGGDIKHAFGAMFERNPIDRILRFLDERSTPWENLMLVASMPPQIFIKAFVKIAMQENLFDIAKG